MDWFKGKFSGNPEAIESNEPWFLGFSLEPFPARK